MTSYNELNGEYTNENRHLLLDILRGDWGYEGMVVTDWGGSNDHVEGIRCRSNLEMPNPGLDSARQVVEAVKSGRMTQEELDVCVDDFWTRSLRQRRQPKAIPLNSTFPDIMRWQGVLRQNAQSF